MGVGDSDGGGRDGEVHGHFCSSDVLYLQKTDLYLGLIETHVVYMCSFMHACVSQEAPRLLLIVSARVRDALRIG